MYRYWHRYRPIMQLSYRYRHRYRPIWKSDISVVMISLFQNICIHTKFFGLRYIFSSHSNSSWNSWKQSILLLFPFFEMLETCWLAKGEGVHVSLRLKYCPHRLYHKVFSYFFNVIKSFYLMTGYLIPTYFSYPCQFLLNMIVVDLKLAYFTHSCMRGFVATRPPYSDVYHYVYICGVQPSADTSFSALREYRR